MLEVRRLDIPEVIEILPRKFGDDRGFFSETYNASRLADVGLNIVFVQDNHSHSSEVGVVRGLHYQLPPFEQDKLIRVISGRIYDVAVDIRRSSASFGKWVGRDVSAERWNQILVPKGFAHGFVTTEANTEVVYKVSAPYAPEHERAIRFDDPELAIVWPGDHTSFKLSEKDRQAPLLMKAELFS